MAKKPYNPIIGEIFQCSWRLSTPSTKTETTDTSETPQDPENSGVEDDKVEKRNNEVKSTTVGKPILVTFCGEQVSHHPPISAFRINCSQRRLQLVGAVHTTSHFRGLSIFVNFVGKGNCL